jgi:hypothetical protein
LLNPPITYYQLNMFPYCFEELNSQLDPLSEFKPNHKGCSRANHRVENSACMFKIVTNTNVKQVAVAIGTPYFWDEIN